MWEGDQKLMDEIRAASAETIANRKHFWERLLQAKAGAPEKLLESILYKAELTS